MHISEEVGEIGRIIVTNNPLAREEFEGVIFVQGSYREVLVSVRDLIHQGHELINHPLGASIRMIFSPYRSIIMGDKVEEGNEFYTQTIESAIENYDKLMTTRNVDFENSEDYARIDRELLLSAIEEDKLHR